VQYVLKVLLTGFGPFPGAPFNPTGPLVRYLARQRHRSLAGVRRVAHVFPTSYAAVDRELPMLIAREQPAVVLMFGVAMSTRHVRIETCARNVLSRRNEDAAGHRPSTGMIVAGGPAQRGLPSPARRLVDAVRAAGVPAAPSRDAGDYLCNYLCWRASEAAQTPRGPRLVAFIHVPPVRPIVLPPSHQRRPPATLGDLVVAGEAILLAAVATVRTSR
jgi:pyroglutamyl-peptidase